jgi:hypothetical protein
MLITTGRALRATPLGKNLCFVALHVVEVHAELPAGSDLEAPALQKIQVGAVVEVVFDSEGVKGAGAILRKVQAIKVR